MVPEIGILSFYTYTCTMNVDNLIYGFWNIRCDRQKFLSFWAIFCPFSPLTTRKIKVLKLKKTPGDIIISHICTINDNLFMYGSWDMEHNIILCHSGSFFALLPPYGPRKSKFRKNEKNTWRYYHFTNINNNHMIHGSSDMKCNGQNFLSFWTVFCPFTP